MRINRYLSIFAASLIAFAPVHALAQDPEAEAVSVRDRPRPEYDPLGVRLGAFMLNGSLNAGVQTTDNVFASETGEQEDTIMTVGADARLSSTWSRHALAAEAGLQSHSYDDLSSEDHDTSYAGIRGRLDVGRSSNVSMRARVAHQVEPRNDPEAPAMGIPLVEYDRTELSVSAQHTFNRFRVTGSAWQNENEYDGVQAFRDFDETGFSGRLDAEVSARMGVFVEASFDERDYNNTPTLSSDGQTYLVGAAINFTDLMLGEIAVGAFEREYDFGASTDGLAVSGNLEWYITRLTTITLNARRNTEDVVGATTAQPYVETRFGGRIDHELMRNVILTAGAQVSNLDFDTIDREDDGTYFDAGADWVLNRRVAVEGRFVHEEVESTGVNRYRDYEDNRLQIGLRFRL